MMNQHTNAWANWFAQNAPNTEFFLYLIDESSNYAQTENWAQWIKNNPGIGTNVRSFATHQPAGRRGKRTLARHRDQLACQGDTTKWQETPTADLDRAASEFFCVQRQAARQRQLRDRRRWRGPARAAPGRSTRKAWTAGSSGEATYYNDYQGGRGQTDVFRTPTRLAATTRSTRDRAKPAGTIPTATASSSTPGPTCSSRASPTESKAPSPASASSIGGGASRTWITSHWPPRLTPPPSRPSSTGWSPRHFGTLGVAMCRSDLGPRRHQLVHQPR